MKKRQERIRSRGLAFTGGRDAILRALDSAAIPLSPKEIHAALPEPRPDLATVYRNLQVMEVKGLVRCVPLRERARRYEPVRDGRHGHRVVCRRCGRIEPFDAAGCDLSVFERVIRRRFGFKVEEHTLEFYGLCPECR